MTKYDKMSILKIVKQNEKFLTSVSYWNDHAVKNNLPRAATIAYHFDGWNKFKSLYFDNQANLNKRFSSHYETEDLASLAKEHQIHFTSSKHWDTYASNEGLPSSKVFIYNFNSWNEAKEVIFGDQARINRLNYDIAKLIKIGRDHKTEFTSRNNWNLFSKKCYLPSASTFENAFGSWNKARLSITGDLKDIKVKSQSLSHKQLIELAIKHNQYLKSKKQWDEFAIARMLPRAETYANRFGTWNKAKQIIEQAIKGVQE